MEMTSYRRDLSFTFISLSLTLGVTFALVGCDADPEVAPPFPNGAGQAQRGGGEEPPIAGGDVEEMRDMYLGDEEVDAIVDVELAGEEVAGDGSAGVEPAGEGLAGVEPAGVDFAGAESAGADPAGAESAGAESAGAEPAEVETTPPLPNRVDEPLDRVLQGISHFAPIDLNGDGVETEREVQITGLTHPLLLDRDAVIYLPEAYLIEPNRRFPVLYAHDAQNLFSPYAPFGEWRLDEVMDVLTATGLVEPHIIVGIDHTPARIFDYTPTEREIDGERIGGGAFAYAELIVNRLKPYIDLHFRTRPERAHTSLMGSSLGGLVSLYIYQQAFTTFGRVAAVSASLWWHEEPSTAEGVAWRWLTRADGVRLPLPDRVWVDIGGAEAVYTFLGSGRVGDYTRHPYQSLLAELRARGLEWGPNQAVGYLEDPFAEHHEPAWARRAPHLLRHLLSELRPDRLSELVLTVDQPHLTSGRSCERSQLRLEARYGDGLRLTVPADLITYQVMSSDSLSDPSSFNVSLEGEVWARPELFEAGGALSSPDAVALSAEVEASFGGMSARVRVTAGGGAIPRAQLIVSAPSRPLSLNPSADQIYVASPLSEPTWRPDGVALSSLDALSSPELLRAIGGRDRWWGIVPVSPDPDGERGANPTLGECAPSCAAAQLSLKITRGTWESVEGAEVNVDRANHEISLPRCSQEASIHVDAWLDGE